MSQPNFKIELPEPWYWTDQDLYKQLKSEVSRMHILFGNKGKTIARRIDNDDVLFEFTNAAYKYAIVHLTWSKQVDSSGKWPSTIVYDNWERVYEVIKRDEKDYQ